jgi:hypothetical protein
VGESTAIDFVSFSIQVPDSLPSTEDFDTLPPGAVSNGAPTWTATRANGVFHVSGGRLQVGGAGPEGVFETSLIDCLGFSSVLGSVDVVSEGNLEPSDYAQLIAIGDGGSEVILDETTSITA